MQDEDGWGRVKTLTFEEDKFSLAVFVDSVDLGRQAPPEDADEHGVSWHDRVIPHPPKPVVLEEKKETR